MDRNPQLTEVIRAGRTAAALCADWTAGNSKPIKIPMMATTTSSSTSVKPSFSREAVPLFLIFFGLEWLTMNNTPLFS